MKMHSTVSFVCLAIVLLAGAAAWSNPVEWPTSQGGNGHYYEYVQANVDWNSAVALAQSRSWLGAQGHLAVITSAEENAWVWNTFGAPFQAWLGASQPSNASSPSDGWTWVTGEEWSYTNWWPNEPNDAGTGNEWALHFAQAGMWNDVDGGLFGDVGMIVEYEPGVVSSDGLSWGAVKALYAD